MELVALKFVSFGFDTVAEGGSPMRFRSGLCAGRPSIDALIPALYLKEISTGDFTESLGSDPGLKAERSFVG